MEMSTHPSNVVKKAQRPCMLSTNGVLWLFHEKMFMEFYLAVESNEHLQNQFRDKWFINTLANVIMSSELQT